MTVAYGVFSGLLVSVAATVAMLSFHSPSRNRFTKALHWRAQRKSRWVALFLYEGFVAFVIGWASEILKAQTLAKGESFWLPDIQPPYSPEALYDLFRGYGADGRNLYFKIELWDIFVYGQGYALLLSSALQWVSGDQVITQLSMLPWRAWAFDQVENAAQTYCVLSFDEEGPSAVWRAAAIVGCAANVSKWVLFAVAIVSFVRIVAKRHIEKRTKSD